MEAWGLARDLHVVGVVLWIGGLAMITTVLLPAVQRFPERDAMVLFERIEHRFASQARWTTLLVGLSGLYLVHTADLWARFVDAHYWWMHAMVLVWALFTVMLLVLEPLVLHRWFAERARSDLRGTLRIVKTMHWILLALSLATVVGAAAGSHGLSFG